jgi:hypothetical protein
MTRLTAKVAGIVIESFFQEARPFSREYLTNLSVKALSSLSKYGVTPEGISLLRPEAFFGYEFGFPLFTGSGVFKLTAQTVNLVFNNIQNQADLDVVLQAINEIYGLLGSTMFQEHALTLHAHMDFADAPDSKARSRFSDKSKQIEFLGVLAHLKVSEWDDPIRLTIDKSLFLPDGIFASLSSKYRGSINSEVLMRGNKAVEAAFKAFDLWYNPEPKEPSKQPV